jgi:hypothetical protein
MPLLGLSTVASAQRPPELGIRLGETFAVDATLPIAQAPRLHGAVYLERFGVGAYGNWIFRLSEGPRNLGFYVGAGPELFFESQFDIHATGDLGLEWAFAEVPITVGFDWRPSFRFTNNTKFLTSNWGFTARFRFGGGTFVADD